MAQLPNDPILLRDLPNDAMYIGREWWEYMRGQDSKLRELRATLRALLRDYPDGIPSDEIERLSA